MKPENILLDENGNSALADFGISKILNPKESTMSFVGTPEYVAPEILAQKGHDKTVDIWCFGTIIYEMVFGRPPFSNKNQNVMMKWIVNLDPIFPNLIKISSELEDLISKCLKKDPKERIGYGDINLIKKHPWFKDINWSDVENLLYDPPIKPNVKDKHDVNHFDINQERESKLISQPIIKSKRN